MRQIYGKMKRIGGRIKKRRELLHLHLNELAEKVAISSSALSQIENSKSYPSVLTLKSIADALHTTIGELVGENETLTDNPVVYNNDTRIIKKNSSGAAVFCLSLLDQDKLMDALLIRLQEGADINGLFNNKHSQVFCRVLCGEISVTLNKKSYVLKQGDNLYFDSWLEHSIANNYSGLTEIIWVQSPPE